MDSLQTVDKLIVKIEFVYSLFCEKEVILEKLISATDGRFPRARLQPLPSLRSVQGLQLVLFPLESPSSAPINGVSHKMNKVMEKFFSMVINLPKTVITF